MRSRVLNFLLVLTASLLLIRCSSSEGGFDSPSPGPTEKECTDTGNSLCADPCTETPDAEECTSGDGGGEVPKTTAKSCKELYANDKTSTDGYYEIVIDDATDTTLTVYCDMTNGGWTEITNSIAETYLSGTAALVAGKSKKITFDTSSNFSGQLCAYGKKGFTYQYKFNVPFGYTQFYLQNYQIKANGQTKKSSNSKKTKIYKSEIKGKKFKQSKWTKASSTKNGGLGDVSFGTPSNDGPTTSFATESEDKQQCDDCTINWPKNQTHYTASDTEQTVFQIEWGEYSKKEIEGWCAWHSGTIFFY